jgi:hypothetical protein
MDRVESQPEFSRFFRKYGESLACGGCLLPNLLFGSSDPVLCPEAPGRDSLANSRISVGKVIKYNFVKRHCPAGRIRKGAAGPPQIF